MVISQSVSMELPPLSSYSENRTKMFQKLVMGS